MKQFFFILCILMLSSQTAYALQGTFKQEATVKGKFIILEDIVSFTETTVNTERIKDQIISKSPTLGHQLILKKSDVLRKLASENNLPAEIFWNGSDNTTITAVGNIVQSDQINNIIHQYLSDNLPEYETTFSPRDLVASVTLPSGELEYEVKPSRPAIIGSTQFTIRFSVDGKIKKTLVVRGRLKVIAQIAVASSNLNKDEILSPDTYTFEDRDINKLKNVIFDRQQMEGKKLTRRISNNTPILLSNLDKIPIIKKGQRIKVLVKSGNLELSMIGIAKGNGGIDDMIRVQNINSNKTIYAQVIAPGLVEVHI